MTAKMAVPSLPDRRVHLGLAWPSWRKQHVTRRVQCQPALSPYHPTR